MTRGAPSAEKRAASSSDWASTREKRANNGATSGRKRRQRRNGQLSAGCGAVDAPSQPTEPRALADGLANGEPAGGEPVRTPSGVLLPADIDPFHRRLHRIAPSGLIGDTTQTSGMRRREAISGKTVGAENLWMGQTHVPGATSSGNHHHGASETAIYVVSGNPLFVFVDLEGGEPVETRIETAPGDYVFVPPYVPHREENPDPDREAVVVIARSTQEAIVVNLPGLYALSPDTPTP